MGNTFFLRLQTIPAISAYLRQLEDVYEHHKHKNKIFRFMFDVAEFWLFIAKFTISPVCAKFEEKVFNFDVFACKCLDHLQDEKSVLISLIQLPHSSCQYILGIKSKLHIINIQSFPLSLVTGISFSQILVNKQALLGTWRRFVELGCHGNADLVTIPKKLVVAVYSYMVGCFCFPEGAWLASISNFLLFLSQSFNGPCKDFIKILPWLCDHQAGTKVVIGYVPTHPDDLSRMWQNRLQRRLGGKMCHSCTTR